MNRSPWPTSGTPGNANGGGLTRLQFWSCVAAGVTFFVFVTGPIWKDPWDIDRVTRAALYTYIPLPLLVAGCLRWSGRLTWRSFLIETLGLTLVKYGITFGLMLALWGVGGPPQHARRAAPAERAARDGTPDVIVPTPVPPESTGAVEGVVVDAAGAPLAGVLVHVASGLEGITFAPPHAPVRLENDGHHLTPAILVAQVGQTIEARATDGHLHTLVAALAEGAPLFNVPLLSGGAASSIVVREAHPQATLRCSVHPGSAEEATLLVLPHPFFRVTGADGAFAWTGVPAGKLRVAAARPGQAPTLAEIDVAAGAAVKGVRLAVAPGRAGP